MVVEREPPKASPEKAAPTATFRKPFEPEFGKPSPLQSRSNPNPNIFNVPRPNKPRPEHHLDKQPKSIPFVPPNGTALNLSRPLPTKENHAVGIARPSNPPIYPSYAQPPPRPIFHAPNSVHPYYVPQPHYVPEQHLANFSNPRPGQFNDPLLWKDNFEDDGPLAYISSEKANDDIKALLEGNIEDEEEKPRTDKLDKLKVEPEKDSKQQPEEDENDEEEEVDDGSVEGLEVKLLPHQVHGTDWMRAREVGGKKTTRGVRPKGGILADDMGLGKTIQSLALILTNSRPPVTSAMSATDKKALPAVVGKGTLVVAPLALIKQWESEIKDKVSESHKLRVLVHHGPQRTKRFEDLKKYDIVITTYQILVSEHGSSSEREDGPKYGCFGLHWYRVILDEAHTIKNRNAKATQAACALRSEYRWCLTGTPMQNNLDELQSLVKFLRIKPFNELSVWRDQITRPMSQGKGALAIRPPHERRPEERRRLESGGKVDPNGKSNGFKITKRDVQSLVVDFTPEERTFYEQLEKLTDKSLDRMMNDHKLNYASALVLLLRLRQACNHSDLVGGSMAKDKDALTTGKVTGSQISTKLKKEDDLDDMADLFGGLSVQTKQCDVCMIDLSEEEISSSMKRCAGCEDLVKHGAVNNKKSKDRKSHNRTGHGDSKKVTKPRNRNKKIVADSSDDEGEGEWIVSKDRSSLDLGKAGGSDDENAEGGGEWLDSSNCDTEGDSDIKTSGSQQQPINVDSSIAGSDTASYTESSSPSNTNSTAESDGSEGEENESDEAESFAVESPMASAKISHLIPILNREAPSHKIIVFSVFTSMLDLIEPHLQTSKLKYTRYDGSMRNDLREASLERLRNEKSCRILLCSLKCGSLGLNLTAASRVIILEPFWNPFVEEQAIDRVHRLNQTKDVVVYKLTVKATVEERILELQEKKRALANAAIEGKDKAGKLSMEDMLKLFKRDAEHDPGHAGDVELGSKPSVLHKKEHESSQRRASPPVAERPKGRLKEDPVYGRRW
ncbi:uncharacterized protein KY384_002744 [Bacidia gigantensis]|uniref:uncharacterized protein n=1 Tax=Bacidia gigantensis TaxID=2732470 RepID=UPI001D0403EB|nr:uncharacterized protein KY384_002744 [Bacidia gigantensis]KAG8532866.1 hypothetical protein KY384_002744 [Bacidia gigantensis]